MAERKAHAKKELERMSGLDAFPAVGSPAFGELMAAIQTAPTLIAMTRFVDDWLLSAERSPVPKNIRDAFRPAENRPRNLTGCPFCDGNGFIIVERSDGVTGAKRCKCFGAAAAAAS